MKLCRKSWLGAALLFGGCATAPLVIDSTHPASVAAAEGATPAARSTLRADATTTHTRELLAQRQKQAESAEAEKPINPGTVAAPKTEGHEHPQP